jgi:hypothetical protein
MNRSGALLLAGSAGLAVIGIVLLSRTRADEARSSIARPSLPTALPLDTSTEPRSREQTLPMAGPGAGSFALDVVLAGLPAETQLVPWPGVELRADQPADAASGSGEEGCQLQGLRTRLGVEGGTCLASLVTLDVRVAHQSVDVAKAGTEVAFDAREFAGLRGRVLDEQGQPLRGASVTLRRYGKRAGEGGALVATTTVDGVYSLPFLSPDDAWSLVWTANQRRSKAEGPFLTDGRTLRTLPDVVLERGRMLKGKVVTDSGQALAGCRVEVQVQTGPVFASSTSDANGRFVFPGLPRGRTSVWSSLHSQEFADAMQDVDVEGDAEITLTVHAGAWIDGSIVTQGGEPVPDVRVWGFPLAEVANGATAVDLSPVSTESDGAGVFRLGPLPPGLVHLTAPFDGAAEQVVKAPSKVTLLLPGSQAWSVLLSFAEQDGSPLDVRSGNATVSLGSGAGRASRSVPVALDKNGDWLFEKTLPKGQPSSLELSFPGHELAHVPDLGVTTGSLSALRVLLVRTRACTVRVTDESGASLSRAEVYLQLAPGGAAAASLRRTSSVSGNEFGLADDSAIEGGRKLATSLATDRNGIARFDNMTPGTFTWLVRASSHLPRTGVLRWVDVSPSTDLERTWDLEVVLARVP